MTSYSDFIKNMHADGQSLEDIAAAFSNALNEIEKENAKVDERESYLRELYEVYLDGLANGNLSMDAVVGYVTEWMADNNHPEWTVDQCKEFYNQLKFSLPYMANGIGKSFGERIGQLLGDGISKWGKKQEEELNKEPEIWTTISKPKPLNFDLKFDAGEIDKFMKELGL